MHAEIPCPNNLRGQKKVELKWGGSSQIIPGCIIMLPAPCQARKRLKWNFRIFIRIFIRIFVRIFARIFVRIFVRKIVRIFVWIFGRFSVPGGRFSVPGGRFSALIGSLSSSPESVHAEIPCPNNYCVKTSASHAL